MKKCSSIFKTALIMLISICVIICCISCNAEEPAGLWDGATYTEDTTLGDGAKTVLVKIVTDEKTVTFTLHTDAATLSEALVERSLVNDPSFFDTVNGIKADYSVNSSWWKVCRDGDILSVGITDVQISDGDVYEIVYTIGF